MDLNNVYQLLIAYVPALTVLLGFLASCFGFLNKIKGLLKESNIEEIKSRINIILGQLQELTEENKKLKQKNNELLGELKRIAGYGDDDE